MKKEYRKKITSIYNNIPIIMALFITSLFLFINIANAQIEGRSSNPSPKMENSKNNPSANPKNRTNAGEEIDKLKNEIEILKKKIDQISALEIGGFFDVSISNYKNKPNIFAIGDFELDIRHVYKENLQVAAALVFHEGAELKVGFIDYHIFGSAISPRGRLFEDDGLHIQIGKFDVPFGNDWQNYPSINRISVTPPLTTEMVMEGGYNDEGIRILFNLVSINATIFMLDGIEEKYSYGGNSFGGRIGLTPFNNPYMLSQRSIPVFEMGFSYIHDIDSSGYIAERVYAFDFESKIDPMILRGEYYYRDKSAGIIFDGYHITCAFDFKNLFSFPLIFFCRYDHFKMENYVPDSDNDIIPTEDSDKNDDKLSRITAGVNINISDISFLKLEYQHFIQTYEDYRKDAYYSEYLYYIQLVITF